jgi:diguanylate cyclase (GGDEF)-like protein
VLHWQTALGNVALGEFVILAVVATSEWYRHRARGAGWAALAFGLLGAVSLSAKIVTEVGPSPGVLQWFYKVLVAALFLFPYCFFHFSGSFLRPPRWSRAAAAVLTVGVMVYTLLLSSLPVGAGAVPPPGFLAYRVLAGCQWGFLFTFAAVSLWLAGRGQTTTAAHRMRLLAVATAGLDVQIIVGVFNLNHHAPVVLASYAFAVVMGVLFILGLVLPNFVRTWWRRHEGDEFRTAVAELMTVETTADVASGLLPQVCALVGASSASLVDGDGWAVGHHVAAPTSRRTPSPHGPDLDYTVDVMARMGSGHTLTVRISPYMPYLGRRELDRLEELGDLVGLAMDRCALAQFERDAQAALSYQSLHDSLTGLPNRDLLVDRLDQAVAVVERNTPALAVLSIDLDRFKFVNDSVDHAAGDGVLIEVGNRLKEIVKAGDTVARVGGDEFVALVQIDNEDQAILLAERIRVAIGAPVLLDGREVSVTASVGVVVTRNRQDVPSRLLSEADDALYAAKEAGRDQVQLFNAQMRTVASERMQLERDLRRAIAEGELRLLYQPIFRLSDGVAVGVEALVRWEHPDRGLLSPDAFIPMAEETGLIVPLGAWVLNEAGQQAARWKEIIPDLNPFTVWVNKSADQFHRTDVVRAVLDTLATNGLDPSMLGVEITEGLFMSDTQQLRTSMGELKAHGVSIAIDDFGTGFSSLGYLKRFPIDILKIDLSFVQGIGREPETSLVTACLAMARSLGIRTVAEGVESAAQGAWLTRAGCDFVQGYAYSFPLEAEKVTEILISSRRGASRILAAAVAG